MTKSSPVGAVSPLSLAWAQADFVRSGGSLLGGNRPPREFNKPADAPTRLRTRVPIDDSFDHEVREIHSAGHRARCTGKGQCDGLVRFQDGSIGFASLLTS